jgi:hypothetical protein
MIGGPDCRFERSVPKRRPAVRDEAEILNFELIILNFSPSGQGANDQAR